MKLGRWQGSALAVSFVVGSGILVLPVLSVQIAGPRGSLYAWGLMTLIALPMIFVFYRINSRKGGTIVQYFTGAFGERAGFGAKATILGALLFGMPAMVHTAASLVSRLLSLREGATAPVAHVLLAGLCLNQLRPLRRNSRISLYSAGFLLLLIAVAVVTHFGDLVRGIALIGGSQAPLDRKFLEACTLTFFGYVGWESLSFFADELAEPERDLKWVFGLSFGVVAVFYLALSAVISGSAAVGAVYDVEQGVLSLLPAGAVRAVALLVFVLLLLANLNAWAFAGAKQIREIAGPWGGSERASVGIYFILTTVLLSLLSIRAANLSDMFLVSSQSWIVIYAGILAYYFKLTKSGYERAIGILGSASLLLLLSGCSWFILFNGLVFLKPMGSIVYHRRQVAHLPMAK